MAYKNLISPIKKNDYEAFSVTADSVISAYNALKPDSGSPKKVLPPLPGKTETGTVTDGTTTPVTQPETVVQSAYDTNIDKLEKEKEDAEGNAEDLRKKAVEEAYKSIIGTHKTYRESISTAGANAEKLAQAGLQNSGYSKFIDNSAADAKATGLEKATTAMSDAKSAYETTLKDIDSAYTDAVGELDSKLQSAYNTTLTGVSDGSIDINTALQTAEQAGYTEEMISGLKDASVKYMDKNFKAYETQINGGSYVTPDVLNYEVENSNLTREQADKLLEKSYTAQINNATDEASLATVLASIDSAYQNGQISDTVYRDTYRIYSDELTNTLIEKDKLTSGELLVLIQELALLRSEEKITQSQEEILLGKVIAHGWSEENNGITKVSSDTGGYEYKTSDNERYKPVTSAENISNRLNKISTGVPSKQPKRGTIVNLNGKTYMLVGNDTGRADVWKEVEKQ